MRRLLTTLVLPVAMSLSSARASASDARAEEFFGTVRSIELLGKVYNEVTDSYVDSIDTSEFVFAGIEGMLESLDPYTVFLDKEESLELGEITSGQYGGIGVVIASMNGGVYIVSVFEGFAAHKAGLEVGDRLAQINGRKLESDSLDMVKGLLKGAPGSVVRLEVSRRGQPRNLKFRLEREEVMVNSVRSSTLAGSTGYIELGTFGSRTREELRQAILQLSASSEGSMNGLVLDLRDNPGGLLDVAVDVAGLFVEKGSHIVTIKGRERGSANRYLTTSDPLLEEMPVVVLINSKSASASEIVAGALQELDRAVVIGERSFGKGLVQSIVPLPYDCKIKLTSARYYTPSGRLIHRYKAPMEDERRAALGISRSDSLKVYYTRNKRKVYGGGGILPDIMISGRQPGRYESELLREGLLFRFARQYRADHTESPSLPLDYEQLLGEFRHFLEKEDYRYRSEASWRLDDVRESLEREAERPSGLDSIMTRLDEAILQLARKEVERESEDISRSLAVEILRHYSEPLSAKVALNSDPVVSRARELLASPEEYRAVLSSP